MVYLMMKTPVITEEKIRKCCKFREVDGSWCDNDWQFGEGNKQVDGYNNNVDFGVDR